MEDRDSQELAKRRIEEEVLKNLEGRLFRYYRNVGSIILAVCGVFGISLWTALPSYVSRIVTEEIKDKVQDPIAQARTDAEQLTKSVGQTLVKVQTQSEEVHKSIGWLSLKSNEILSEYGKSQAQLDEVQAQAQSVISLANDSSKAAKYLATQDDIARLANTVASLAEQTANLAKAMEELQLATGNSGSVDTTQHDRLTDLKVEVEKITPSVLGPAESGIVYIQFAGGKREDIRQISESLRKLNWSVPGEERVGAAAGLSEVRYFYQDERPKAEKLSLDLTTLLKEKGLFIKAIQLRDVSQNSNIKLPRRGILEVWIEIPVR